MKGNLIRWILAGLMICSLAFLISSPALAEVTPLDLDQNVFGVPAHKENWISIPGADALNDERVLSHGTAQTSVLKYDKNTGVWAPTGAAPSASKFDWKIYEDASISVRTEFASITPAYKSKTVPSSITYITVADPSQIRTAMSYDDYSQRKYVKAEKIAQHVNAIASVNGDFFKYHYNVGYVLRQGVFYRDKLNGKRDLLAIDNNGDFHTVYAATSETMEAFMNSLPEGMSIVNTFTLGPVLVENGTARAIKTTSVADSGEFQWCYPQQRVAVLQTGPLSYAIVETYGKTDSSAGLTLQEFADYIAYLFPDCLIAYNLDGGGSTNVVVDGARVHTTPGNREISDILYFASADME